MFRTCVQDNEIVVLIKKKTCLIFLLDLQTVTERLHSGYYSCVRLFRADMRRLFSNSKQFNDRNSDYYRCAVALEKFFLAKMAEASLDQAEPSVLS